MSFSVEEVNKVWTSRMEWGFGFWQCWNCSFTRGDSRKWKRLPFWSIKRRTKFWAEKDYLWSRRSVFCQTSHRDLPCAYLESDISTVELMDLNHRCSPSSQSPGGGRSRRFKSKVAWWMEANKSKGRNRHKPRRRKVSRKQTSRNEWVDIYFLWKKQIKTLSGLLSSV